MDRSILHALEHLGCASVTLKDEQTACVKAIYEGKDVFLEWKSIVEHEGSDLWKKMAMSQKTLLWRVKLK